jgi:ribosomal protein L23
MALFGRKKQTENTAAVPAAITPRSTSLAHDHSSTLLHARITEKATENAGLSVYTFDVSPSATKRGILQAVKKIYGVTPRKIAIVRVPSKNVRSMRTGKRGVKSGGKKAYVYLKKGETITIA